MTDEEMEAVFCEINCLAHSTSTDVLALEQINRHPFVATYAFLGGQLLCSFVGVGFLLSVRRLLELGADVNWFDKNGVRPLTRAVGQEQLEVAELLLENGADPNLERVLITATRKESADAFVSLLIRHGARVNDLYAMFEDKSNLKTTLDFVPKTSPMHDLLRSMGAKTAKEVLAENPNAPISDQ